MTILQPEHPVFRFPNRITPSDWEGWVQERSLYHLTDLGSGHRALLEATDPGEEPHPGGMVYAAFAFFRQLPDGVPGAYRLSANLLSLPKAPR